jgi:3-methyladenine DNA glycosylase AlkD
MYFGVIGLRLTGKRTMSEPASFDNAEEIISYLKSRANPDSVAEMARYGINPRNTLGVSMPTLQSIAKQTGKKHQLAGELWATDIHEARILAAFVDDANLVTAEQMEQWVVDFDSWDICDGVCLHLFKRTAYAYQKAFEWSSREKEFVKRAGFVLIACLAVWDKKAPDETMEAFLPVLLREAADERNYVKKAINWALRQIGKRNRRLNAKAIETAKQIARLDSRAARWVAADALRELSNPKIQSRLKD